MGLDAAAIVQRPNRADSNSQSDDQWCGLARDAAAAFGTPCYVSRWRPVLARVESLERRFGTRVRSWLSFKTHPVPQLAAAWIRSGRGVEVVSEAEFAAVRAIGCPVDQLLVNGVGKHTWLDRVDVPQLRVHFDSVAEATALLPTAVAQSWRIGLRCHVPPECDGPDRGFGGQFGLSADEVTTASAALRRAGVAVSGLHFHLGPRMRHEHAYTEALRYLVDLCLVNQIAPQYIDCGGSIDANPDVEASVDDLESAIARLWHDLPSVEEVWLENGRYLTAGSAALVVRVQDVKDRPECRYLICDGGRTNHALDADNGPHRLLVIPSRAGQELLTTVAGPTCMTDDRLGRLMLPQTIAAGDLLVWLDAGAYHLPWETRFSHGLCAVAWADGDDQLSLARRRETPGEWSALWTAAS
jgi:diaminopimelate decarboxylase